MANVIRIVKNWNFPDWRRMSPGSLGRWGQVQLTEDAVPQPDYVIVLNQPSAAMTVDVAPSRIWAIIQEPPGLFHRYLHKGQPAFSRIYTSDQALADRSSRHVGSFPLLSWHVNRTFDQLVALPPIPPKSRDLSWITSTLGFLPGHAARMKLLDQVRQIGLADLFGRGLNPVLDKWDALASYRYSIVYENYIGPYYWSEKLIDCFLAGAMPIYVGCTNLSDYFPEQSFIRLDPNTSDLEGTLRRIIASDAAEANREHLIEARRRCLFEHQLFPFIANEVRRDREPPAPARPVTLRKRHLRHPLHLSRAVWYWKISPALRSLSWPRK